MELDDKAAFEASVIENIQRQTLNPLDEVKAFKTYVDVAPSLACSTTLPLIVTI